MTVSPTARFKAARLVCVGDPKQLPPTLAGGGGGGGGGAAFHICTALSCWRRFHEPFLKAMWAFLKRSS